MSTTVKVVTRGIDKLRFGTQTMCGQRDNVLNACRDLVLEGRARRLSTKNQVHRHRFSIRVVEDETMLVAFDRFRPDSGHQRFMVELNPNKLGPTGMEQARLLLREMLGLEYENVMSRASVALADYFIDFSVRPQDLLIDIPRKESCAVWGIQFNGRFVPQTLYFGAGGTDGQTRVYDTEAQATAALGKAGREGTIETAMNEAGKVVGSRMRIETRRRFKAVALRDLATVPNPFGAVQIAMVESDAPEFDEPVGRLLLMAARTNGWQLALKSLGDRDLERKYRRAFAKHACNWWDPKRLAPDLLKCVAATGLFPAWAIEP